MGRGVPQPPISGGSAMACMTPSLTSTLGALRPEDGRHPYCCWLLLFQNKVLDVDGMKVKLQVSLQEYKFGAGGTGERLGSMTSACCHRSGTQLVRSGSEVSPMPTTGMLMVRHGASSPPQGVWVIYWHGGRG